VGWYCFPLSAVVVTVKVMALARLTESDSPSKIAAAVKALRILRTIRFNICLHGNQSSSDLPHVYRRACAEEIVGTRLTLKPRSFSHLDPEAELK